MKRLFTLLCFCFIAYSQALHAQGTPPRLIAYAYSSFSIASGTRGVQYYGDSTQYQYTPAHTYNSKKGWQADTNINWYNASTVWAGYHLQDRVITKYDDSGNQTVFLDQSYNYTDTSWHNRNMDSMAYDAHNNAVYIIYKNWDAGTADWQNQMLYKYDYSASNKLLSMSIQNWDNTSGSWINYYRYAAVYSSADGLLADSTLTWNGTTGTWGTTGYSSSDHYVYDSHHHIVTDTTWQWSVSNSAWLPQWIDDSFSYNSSDKIIYERYQKFDTLSMTWNETDIYKAVYDAAGHELSDTSWINTTPYWLRTFINDAAGNVLTYTFDFWDNAAGKWQDSIQYNHTYDTHGNILANINKILQRGKGLVNQDRGIITYNGYYEILTINGYTWDTTSAAWLHSRLSQYYYDSLTGVATVQAPAGASISLYPVPAATTLTIDIKWPQPHTARLAIYDVNGRLYRQWQTDASATYHNSIPVADLPVGNYILVAKQGDAATTARFSISR